MGIRDEDLEGGLFEAFKPPDSEGGSVLDRIERLHGAGQSVLLREADEDVSPVLIRREDESLPRDDARYQILGELARGGIGVVYRGRDKDLNRDIALKVLRPEYAQRADVIQRFVEEAQVAGQLQHPGIVPVYGLGLQEDGRPSFAMKLIKGRTLAELLDSNPRDLDLIAIFEQLAQTMAYAHSRGVIHRDLKPANVMVGAFGEVQVVDWGFAKVLGQEEARRAPDRTVIATVRSGPVGSQSIAGSVMGTPAYMPPEQALGRVDDLDERTDVFALGAILCEILTGRALYTGEPKDQLIAAVQCLLGPAQERLGAADAPDGLKRIVRACLQPLSADRPRSARVVAERLSAYLAGVEVSARQAELDALASEQAAKREAHARRRTLSVAAIALFALLSGGSGYLLWRSDKEAREATAAPLIAGALRQAKRFEGERKWAAAVSATQKAVDLAAMHGAPDGGARGLLTQYEVARDAAAAEAALDAADRRLLLDLEEARLRAADHYGVAETDAAFVAAVARRWPDMEVDTERLKASTDALRYAASFDAWALLRHRVQKFMDLDWRKVDALSRAIHPASNALRDAMLARDLEGIESLRNLDEVPVPILLNLSGVLLEARRDEMAIALLRSAHRRQPDDFLVNCRLGDAAARIGHTELALQHSQAALVLRPDSIEARHNLGIALATLGDHEEAVRIWREAGTLRGPWSHGLQHIVESLAAQGKLEEARAEIEAGVDVSADDAWGHYRRGLLYDDIGDGERSIAALRRAVAIDPENAEALSWLAGMLANYRQAYQEASETYERVIALRPDCAKDHADLGSVLGELGRNAEAEACFRRAVEWDPSEAAGHIGVGFSHLERGETAAATRSFETALALTPRNSGTYGNLGHGLMRVGRIDEAEEVLRRGVRLSPRHPGLRLNLGALLFTYRQRPAEALVHLRRGLELDPDGAQLHANLGRVLEALGDDEKALEAYRRAVALEPTNAGSHTNLGAMLLDMGKVDEAIRIHERAVRLDPSDRVYWWNLGQAYRTKGDVENTIRAFREMVARAPDHAQSHYQLATFILTRTGDAIAALPLLEKTVRLDPEYAEAWCNLASCLRRVGRIAEALEAIRRGHALGSKRPDWSWDSAQWMKGYELMAATAKRLPAVLAGTAEPRSPREALLLASVAHARGHLAPSVELYRRAFDEAPTLGRDPRTRLRFSAACAAVQAGPDTHPQALQWLQADLTAWRTLLSRLPAQVSIALQSWQREEDLAAVRDGEHATDAWKTLWAEVAGLLEQAQEASK